MKKIIIKIIENRKCNSMIVDGKRILPRDYRALEQYYKIVEEINTKLRKDLKIAEEKLNTHSK